jgi:tetratricopeptide (TPR) repeat protein
MKKSVLFLLMLLTVVAQAQNTAIADSLVAVGQYSKAVQWYEEQGKIPEKYFQMAKVYEATGNKSAALEKYEKYIQIDSTNTRVNYNYGLLLIETTQWKLAEKVFTKLNKEKPSAVHWYYLGEIFEKQEESLKALASYNKSIQLEPDFYKSNYKIAVFYANAKEYSKAFEICNRFLEKDAEDIQMLKLRGQVHFSSQHYDKAITDFEQLLHLEQIDTFIYEKLALSYLANEEYTKARTLYDTLIETINDENPEYYYNRGKCQGFLGNNTEAETDIQKSMALRTFTFENENFYLGYFYQKENNLKKALHYYQKAQKENKNHLESAYQIIAIKDYQGQSSTKTIQEYETFLINFQTVSAKRKASIENRIKQLKQKQHME